MIYGATGQPKSYKRRSAECLIQMSLSNAMLFSVHQGCLCFDGKLRACQKYSAMVLDCFCTPRRGLFEKLLGIGIGFQFIFRLPVFIHIIIITFQEDN